MEQEQHNFKAMNGGRTGRAYLKTKKPTPQLSDFVSSPHSHTFFKVADARNFLSPTYTTAPGGRHSKSKKPINSPRPRIKMTCTDFSGTTRLPAIQDVKRIEIASPMSSRGAGSRIERQKLTKSVHKAHIKVASMGGSERIVLQTQKRSVPNSVSERSTPMAASSWKSTTPSTYCANLSSKKSTAPLTDDSFSALSSKFAAT